ncbi:MAG TPA: hypothetical protein VMV97_03555 [Sulfuriferula sp.]|nr:hypothetical protein [Sulfuriferula sp.]
MIVLGRMGSDRVRRLMRGGHQCVVYNRHAEADKPPLDSNAELTGFSGRALDSGEWR